tara:strand:- start:200 stop:451 length:252 start_codon:yes stop_codon:yes gene_type:complete
MVEKFKQQTVDWYLKWVATVFVLTGMALRTTQEHMFADIIVSLIGALGWMVVAIMWKDRALTLLNVVASIILFYGFILGLMYI